MGVELFAEGGAKAIGFALVRVIAADIVLGVSCADFGDNDVGDFTFCRAARVRKRRQSLYSSNVLRSK